MKELGSVPERIQWVVEVLFGGRQARAVRATAIPQQQFNRYYHGQEEPSWDQAEKFESAGISFRWVKLGQGSPFLQRNTVNEDNNATLYRAKPITGDRSRGIPISVIRTSAGSANPLEAAFDVTADLARMYPEGSALFEVSGRCMVPAGIEPGDLALVQPLDRDPRDGEIVLAMTGDGLTLKRYRVKDGRAMLVPDDPTYKSIPVTGDVHIQGVLHHTIRQPK